MRRAEAGVKPGSIGIDLSSQGEAWRKSVYKIGVRNYEAAKKAIRKILDASEKAAKLRQLETNKSMLEKAFSANVVLLTANALTSIKTSISNHRIKPGLHPRLAEAVDHVFEHFLDEQEEIWLEVERLRGPESN